MREGEGEGGRAREGERWKWKEGGEGGRERKTERERENNIVVLQRRRFSTVHTVPTVGVNCVISSGRIFQESECCQVTKWP